MLHLILNLELSPMSNFEEFFYYPPNRVHEMDPVNKNRNLLSNFFNFQLIV